ncbi:MAG: GDP-mannose 4,6-dehydratase, partial [Actinomycetota bacterium]|nr:GDP-mannose 4,6-dehydratase [Actinomycetota bacterium]
MPTAIITGSAGLIGSEAARFFCDRGHEVVGIDNNLRKLFFGEDACTEWNRKKLEKELSGYRHENIDIRDDEEMRKVFERYGDDTDLVIHAAAQPSHDWAASNPYMDFSVNALGTLVTLENFRRFCPEAVFIFTSTNKVYGDSPNRLPLVELETRYELESNHGWY